MDKKIMQFKTITDFIHMGGYGFYVWTAYGLVVLFIAINLFNTFKHSHKLQKKLQNTHETTT